MNFFGEVEILLDVPPVVLIRAGADSQLFRLPRAGFWDLLPPRLRWRRKNHADASDAIAQYGGITEKWTSARVRMAHNLRLPFESSGHA